MKDNLYVTEQGNRYRKLSCLICHKEIFVLEGKVKFFCDACDNKEKFDDWEDFNGR